MLAKCPEKWHIKRTPDRFKFLDTFGRCTEKHIHTGRRICFAMTRRFINTQRRICISAHDDLNIANTVALDSDLNLVSPFSYKARSNPKRRSVLQKLLYPLRKKDGSL
jgi:hypothetical protein